MAGPGYLGHVTNGKRTEERRHAMDLGLTGRTAVVTGASRGIGLAITRGLVAHGAHVVAGARASSPNSISWPRTVRCRFSRWT